MAEEKLKAFREAQEAAQAQTLARLGTLAFEAKQKQEAEWAIREAAIKAGEQKRLADLKAKQEAHEAYENRKQKIRLEEARLAGLREIAERKAAAKKAQEELEAERARQEEAQKAIESALTKATEEAVLTHCAFAKQSENVKQILKRLSPQDALECLNSPATLMSLRRKPLREMKR